MSNPSISTIFSPVLTIETANSKQHTVSCHVVNCSNVPVSGEINIFEGTGNSISYGGYNNLPPGGCTGISVNHFNPLNAPVTLVYCRLTVNGCNADVIRGSLVIADKNGNALISALAS